MELTKSEHVELHQQATARNGRADSARHARLILLLARWAHLGRDSRQAGLQRQLH